jgi:hypothetical protein
VTLQTPTRCSAIAAELDEPMIGTVEQRRRWLLVEDRSAWGHDAPTDVLGADLTAAARWHGMRVLLVRRREGDPSADAVRRAILVDTESREMAIRSVTDLASLSLDEVAVAPVADFGAPLADPIFLVCTNGKRDACCALYGRILVGAMAADHGERTWECSHLGGHRFAAHLVCLPDGIVYGRVPPADGPRLADAYLAGRLDIAWLRGRSAWPAPAQVAERGLRLRLGLTGLDEVTLRAADVADERARVELEAGGATYRFELVAEQLEGPRPTSCRGDKLEQPIHWRVAASTI